MGKRSVRFAVEKAASGVLVREWAGLWRKQEEGGMAMMRWRGMRKGDARCEKKNRRGERERERKI
jgi:hypothetical protein